LKTSSKGNSRDICTALYFVAENKTVKELLHNVLLIFISKGYSLWVIVLMLIYFIWMKLLILS
jgi:hypothetical protein